MAKIVESNAICVWVESHSYFSATNRPTGHNQKIQRPADQRIGRPEPPHQELQLPTGGRNHKSIARPNESIQRIKPIEGPTNNKPSMPITNNQCSRPSRHNNNWPTPAAIQQPKFTGKNQQQCDSRIHKKRSLPTKRRGGRVALVNNLKNTTYDQCQPLCVIIMSNVHSHANATQKTCLPRSRRIPLVY